MTKKNNQVQDDEIIDEQNAEVEAKLDWNPSKEENSNRDEVAEYAAEIEEIVGANVAMPAPIAAINTDNDTAMEASDRDAE